MNIYPSIREETFIIIIVMYISRSATESSWERQNQYKDGAAETRIAEITRDMAMCANLD